MSRVDSGPVPASIVTDRDCVSPGRFRQGVVLRVATGRVALDGEEGVVLDAPDASALAGFYLSIESHCEPRESWRKCNVLSG